jgi:hypothetical protein
MFIVWPYIEILVWGSLVESNESIRKIVGTLKIGTHCRALEEHWYSVVNTVISYILTTP